MYDIIDVLNRFGFKSHINQTFNYFNSIRDKLFLVFSKNLVFWPKYHRNLGHNSVVTDAEDVHQFQPPTFPKDGGWSNTTSCIGHSVSMTLAGDAHSLQPPTLDDWLGNSPYTESDSATNNVGNLNKFIFLCNQPSPCSWAMLHNLACSQ